MRVEVGRFASLNEAQIAAGFLRSHGVDAEVPDAHYGSTEPYLIFALGWFRLAAPEGQAAEARRLLEATNAAERTPDLAAERPRTTLGDWFAGAFSLLVSGWAGAPMIRKGRRR